MQTLSSPARLLAIGDIHGCREPLRDLLTQVAPTAADQLVFLGDYVDRGPDSAGVIADLLELHARLPRTIFLCGNHEQMLLDVLAGGDVLTFLLNGGTQTIASYRTHDGWPPPPAHREFLQGLATGFETDAFIFVHAGLRPRIPLERQSPADLLWIREEFLQADADWGKVVVYGHTPTTGVLLDHNRLGLDTGCVFGGHLTCRDVLTRRCWQSRC